MNRVAVIGKSVIEYPMRHAEHEKFMREALAEAQKAAELGEVPVGAVLVVEGLIIARGHNQKETLQEPTAHAEMVAIRQAAAELRRWRLSDATLYCTLEPCPMCAGAMLQARLGLLVYAADDPKAGAAGSLLDLLRLPFMNHQVQVIRGVLSEEAQALMAKFFRDLRQDGYLDDSGRCRSG